MQTPVPNPNTKPEMPDSRPTDQNTQRFLDFLGKAEGADYDVIVGGKRFADYSRHPGVVGLRTKEGPSTAAGKYQITKTTYDEYAPKLGIKDFSPQSQDRIALELIRSKGALEDVQKGDFLTAINKLGSTWASLPSSPYTQPKRDWNFVEANLGVTAGKRAQQTQVAARTQKATKGASPTAKKPMQVAGLDALPESYRTALALNFLADSDPEDEVMSRAIEVLRTTQEESDVRAPAGGTALQKFIKGQEGVDPFQFLQREEEAEPRLRGSRMRRMAQGGEVQNFAVGGLASGSNLLLRASMLAGKPRLSQADKALLGSREAQINAYNQALQRYEQEVADYNREVEEYERRVDDYNRATSSIEASFSKGAGREIYIDRNTGRQVELPSAPSFNRSAPQAPSLGFSQEQYDREVAAAQQSAQKRAAGRALAIDVALDPGKYNLAGFGGAGAFAQGGEVHRQAGSPPQGERANEIPQVGPDGRLLLPTPEPKRELSLAEKARGLIETGATIATGAVAAPIAAVTGLARGKNINEANVEAGKVMEAMTYQPRSEAGKRYLEQFGKAMQESKLDALLPQAQLLNVRVAPGAARYLGEQAKGKVEEAVMPTLRKQAGREDLTPEEVYGAMLGKPSEVMAEAGASYAVRPGDKTKINRDLFINATEELDNLQTTPEVEQVISAHIGGVGDFGDPNAKYYLRDVPGGLEYTKQSQDIAKKYFGNRFMGYRLMPREEFEALQTGDVGDLLSFSLSKDSANAFRRFAPNEGREDLILAEVPLTPSHVLAFGSRGEQEVIVDTSVGWSLDDFKRTSAPKQKEQVDRSLLFPSPERPFVGELERLVADLPGPVQKEQFLNSLKGKARGYEIRRVEEALEDFGATDKVTPNQIMSALKRTSPQRFKLQVLEASDEGRKGFARDYDNPYPARPIGSVNLLLEPGEMQKQVNAIFQDIQDFRANKSTNTVFGNDPTYIDEYARGVMELADRVDEFDTQLARSVKQAAEDVAIEARPIVDLSLARRYVTTPELDPKNRWLVNWNDLEKTVPQEVKDLLRKRGVTTITPEVATMAAKELATVNYLKELNKTINSGSAYANLVRNTLSGYERDMLGRLSSSPDALKIGLEDFYREASDPTKSQYRAERMQDFATEVNGVLRDYDTVLNFGKNEVIKDLRNLTQGMLESDTLLSGKIYEGRHTGIVSQNPISFARFVEVNPFDMDNPPENMQPGQGLLFTELQSDRRSAIQNMRKGLVEEPYPGFAEDPDTLSELMMKSAVAGAAQLNKKLVLFPGADSKQPQLYGTWATEEAKKARDMSQYSPSIMKRVSKKVAKDLGEGYEAREFKTINGAGDEVVRWGIVLPDNASETVPTRGIRFAEGGSVEASL